ncbi:MAG: biotin-dependent carboxyltransferase family protein [Spirochaetaceae bacterium]|jgi:antagonist of KipI|nr:biotin-dependent carboxyltransferase family protein [Spirochaetaceae bacterium]
MTIIDPGFLTTVQDLGRRGYMDRGFSPAGALDGFSFRLANFLVGNPPEEAALEMTLRGSSVVFDGPGSIALTGADMEPLLNGKSLAMNRTTAVVKGDILYTSFAVRGLRSYLAAAGGLDIPQILGSRSTNLRARLGGFMGRKLESKDHIVFPRVPVHSPGVIRSFVPPRRGSLKDLGMPRPYTPQDPLVLHVVEGIQAGLFTRTGLCTFYHSLYTVGNDSDRMGVRLEGPGIVSAGGTGIVSDGIALGAVQVPGSGKPIVLLNDRQTTGGYAKIGALITRDLWLLAQAPGGSAVRFKRISPRRAEGIYIKTEKAIKLMEWKD